MSNEKILDQINATATAGAPLDFAGLMARIEADGGQSTAPQMTAHRAPVGKSVAVAAGAVLVVSLSAAALAGTGLIGGMASEEAAMDSVCDDAYYEPVLEESSAPEYESDDYYSYSDTETAVVDELPDNTGAVTSDCDVSDSDVSGSDADEGQ